MVYRLGAVTDIGSAVSVTVGTAEQALAKIVEYREIGFTKISVCTLDYKIIISGDLGR